MTMALLSLDSCGTSSFSPPTHPPTDPPTHIFQQHLIQTTHPPTYPPTHRYDARIEVEKALTERGLYRGKENNKMRLGICSRSGDIIEPYLTPQWYVLPPTHPFTSLGRGEEGGLNALLCALGGWE